MAFQSGAFQSGAFQIGGDVVAPPTPADFSPKKGGIPSRRYKKPYIVTVDGEDFVVNSLAEAEELLFDAKEALEEAVRVPEKPAQTDKVLPVKAPRIRVSGPTGPDLNKLVEIVAAKRKEFREIYTDAERNIELSYLLRIAAEDDDEEALLLLM